MNLSEKLKSIVEECRLNAYRILIEVEPSGKIYFWCDKNQKRHIIRMVRRHHIKQNLKWCLTDEKTNYVNDYELVYLSENKGKIIKTF